VKAVLNSYGGGHNNRFPDEEGGDRADNNSLHETTDDPTWFKILTILLIPGVIFALWLFIRTFPPP